MEASALFIKMTSKMTLATLAMFLPVTAMLLAQGLDFSGRTNQPAGIDLSGTWYPQP